MRHYSDQSPTNRLAIIGGGISGLAAAWEACKRGWHVDLFEAQPQLGGCISTFRGDGFCLEGGPDSLLSYKPAALQLGQEVGLTQEQLVGNISHAQPVLILKNRRLYPLPDGFRQLAPSRLLPFIASPLLSWVGKLRAILEPFIPPRRNNNNDDETLANFVQRRLGREVLEILAQPLVAGIFAADPRYLSLKSTFPSFLEMEQKHGSLVRAFLKNGSPANSGGASPFVSPANGMASLTEALEQRLRECGRFQLHRNCPVKSLQRTHDWELTTVEGTHQVDQVLMALPALATANILKAINSNLACQIGEIRCRSTATVNLVWKKEEMKPLPDSQGMLAPLSSSNKLSACTFSNQKFPQRSNGLYNILKVHLGGAGREAILDCNDQQLVECATAELQPHLGLRGVPFQSWVRRHHGKMPEYRIGHDRIIEDVCAALQEIPGLELTGNWLKGVGISDCIVQARSAIDRLASKN